MSTKKIQVKLAKEDGEQDWTVGMTSRSLSSPASRKPIQAHISYFFGKKFDSVLHESSQDGAHFGRVFAEYAKSLQIGQSYEDHFRVDKSVPAQQFRDEMFASSTKEKKTRTKNTQHTTIPFCQKRRTTTRFGVFHNTENGLFCYNERQTLKVSLPTPKRKTNRQK